MLAEWMWLSPMTVGVMISIIIDIFSPSLTTGSIPPRMKLADSIVVIYSDRNQPEVLKTSQPIPLIQSLNVTALVTKKDKRFLKFSECRSSHELSGDQSSATVAF